MSDFGEAIGSAVEGGLTARAVEKETAADAGSPATPVEKGHFAEGDCLNCGTSLVGSHCHQCGQKAHLHRTIGAFFHDLMHGALHLEGKMWSTLPLLVFKPGKLTRRYIDGERARFVSPMAMFLFGVFLMFAVFQAVGLTAPSDIQGATNQAISAAAAQEREDLEAQLASLQAELENTTDDASRDRLQRRVDDLRLELMAVSAAENFGAIDTDGEAATEISNSQTPTSTGDGGADTVGDEEPTVRVSSDPGGDLNLPDGETGIEWIDSGIQKWRDNPSLMVYKLQANSYKFSWLLIPLSVPFVWLLFAWKRRFKVYDHAIFVTYSLAFMTLLFIALSLAQAAGVATSLIVFSLLLVPPLHMYKQLRQTYGVSRFGAIWRLMLLTIFIFAVIAIFVQILLLLGAF